MYKRQPARRGHIYARLNRIYLVSMLLPILFLATVFSAYFYRVMQRDDIEMGKSVLNAVELNISTCFERMNRCTLGWVSNEDILNFYRKTNANNGTIPTRPLNLTDRYAAACNTLLSLSGQDVLGIGFYPFKNDDQIFYYFKKYAADPFLTEHFPAEQASWYRSACENAGTPVYCGPAIPSYENREEQPVFSIARVIRDMDTKQKLGVIKVDVSLAYLDAIFSTVRTGGRSGYMILDEQNAVIYSTSREITSLAPFWDPNNASFSVPGRGQYYSSSLPIGRSPWTLIYLVSSDDILQRTNFIFWASAIVGTLALLVAAGLFRLNSVRMAKPVNNILTVMQKNEQGNLTEKIEIDPRREDEFSIISRQYNHMVDMLKLHIDREYKAKLGQQRAEYLALQMQINPHFLYNTLNGFMALNRMGESRLLERAIIQLTELFRYTCSNRHIVSIEDETAFVERYLFLQSLRFGDRLEHTVCCADEARKIRIPKLILQPLVENAVIHGLEPIDRLVHIDVSVTVKDELVCMTVRDDGIGVDLNALRDASHVGLDNVRERIQALLPGGRFELCGEPGEGAVSQILFPIKPSKLP